MDVISRIERGSIPEPNSGCWIWLGAVYRSRRAHEYGVFSLRNKRYSVHRASYEAMHGPIPKGLVCRHHCDVSLCVNPDHLVVGTQADNVADMMRRGRSHHATNPDVGIRAARAANETMRAEPGRRARKERHGMYGKNLAGSANGFAKITEEIVTEITSLFATGKSQRAVARHFGISQKTVWNVVNCKTWQHVPRIAALKARAPNLPEGEK